MQEGTHSVVHKTAVTVTFGQVTAVTAIQDIQHWQQATVALGHHWQASNFSIQLKLRVIHPLEEKKSVMLNDSKKSLIAQHSSTDCGA